MRLQIITLIIATIVISAGCVGQLQSIFGSDVIKPSRASSTTGATDIVVIENPRLLPASPILPDSSAQFMINIVSKETDPRKDAKNVVADLFDAGLFKIPQGGMFCNDPNARIGSATGISACNFYPCGPVALTVGGGISSECTLRPGEVKTVTASLRSPTEDDIAHIKSITNLNYKVSYDYETATSYDILVVTFNEIKRLQQEGQTLSLPLQDIRGSGPIKIEASALTPFVIAVNPGETPQDAYIVLKLKNMGSGSLTNNKILADHFEVSFPQDLVKTTCSPSTYLQGISCITPPQEFTCGQSYSTGSISCTNNVDIEFFRKESIPYQFIIKGIQPIDVPYRTFTITARTSYNYEVRGSYPVTIQPIQIR